MLVVPMTHNKRAVRVNRTATQTNTPNRILLSTSRLLLHLFSHTLLRLLVCLVEVSAVQRLLLPRVDRQDQTEYATHRE